MEVEFGKLKLLKGNRGGEKILNEDFPTWKKGMIDYIFLFIEPIKRPEL
jgi:hypothetical protein